jgi:hypothetical protein
MKNIKEHLLIIITAALFAFALLLLASCQAEEPQPNEPTECNCYEYHEKKVINNQLVWEWMYDYQTTPIPELCSKANDTWVYYGNQSQWRYKTKCN